MREVKGCRTRRGSPVLKLWTKPEMDRPAILKTSRPGVPVRFKGMCWVSIDSCSSVQWKGSQTTIHPPISIVLINPNEQKRPKVFEPSKNGSPLSQKMDEPWAYVPGSSRSRSGRCQGTNGNLSGIFSLEKSSVVMCMSQRVEVVSNLRVRKNFPEGSTHGLPTLTFVRTFRSFISANREVSLFKREIMHAFHQTPLVEAARVSSSARAGTLVLVGCSGVLAGRRLPRTNKVTITARATITTVS